MWYFRIGCILNNLGITQKELREICVLSGTDYNLECDDDNITLNITLKHFKRYHKSQSKLGFYDWLNENCENVIKDYDLLKKIYDMFDLSQNHYNIKLFEKVKIANGPIMKDEIHDILKTDGFLFP